MQEDNEKKSKKFSQLSNNVRHLIQSGPYSQKSYAAIFGIPPKRFNHYITGVSDFPTELFMEIAKREGIEPDVLFYEDLSARSSEPEPIVSALPQTSKSVEMLTETVNMLTSMLSDCIAEKERYRNEKL